MDKIFPIVYPQQASMEQDSLNRKDMVHAEAVDYNSLNEKEWITDAIIRFHQVYLMQTMQLHGIYMMEPTVVSLIYDAQQSTFLRIQNDACSDCLHVPQSSF
ncbi:hypothetical protein BDA99DRAFT_604003 [Phascolomyces articulosus]|uniref:Uncharacterized protein n=1 Tax=Phascolomyces articulosus TaxID=60185 RepID=A0AAD5KCR9_9FUNG|nr:hypothetical protein BDA99DRAFT_604003 [Phascolomyces articulosus]